ncbi:MAG: PIN domain-containing protein [Verrucomicrobia bacterium]|nr:PIN domain-containing protein [Verrucomicrobiota bacterium]
MRGLTRIVTDSTIWIDLSCGGVIAQALGLDVEFLAPDAILRELRDPSGLHLVELGVRSIELSAEQVDEALTLLESNRSLSVQDAFACVLAHSLGAMLLTGDRRLRRIAEARTIEVHGTLWLLTQMVDKELLRRTEAADALDLMRAAGSRVPAEEADRLLTLWRKPGSPHARG